MNKRDFIEHPALCPLPWTGIYINPDGSIKNCAISNTTLGNIHQTALPDILNNSINQGIRQDMLLRNRHSRCDVCYQVENNADDKIFNESNRTWYKKLFIKHRLDMEIFNQSDRFQPLVLDLRWRNTCNRACVYCGPDLSSLWQEMTGTEYKIDESVLARSKEYVFSNLSSVKHVYLAGGEPLLIKENLELLERLLDCNPGVEIRINSNIGNLRTPVYRLLEKFSNVKWTVSVDSMDQSFEYMRWPGLWSEFFYNLQQIKALGGDINFNMVWCILNDRDILHTVDFLLDQGYHENMFVIQCLTSPQPLNVLNLPAQIRSELQDSIADRRSRANPTQWLYRSLSSMYNFLESGANNQDLDSTFQFLRAIDSMRGIDSRQIFPKLYQYQ